MMRGTPAHDSVAPDDALRALVRFAARIAVGADHDLREGAAECVAAASPVAWVEEVLLQSYLICGFPRTLNATREWRRVSGTPAPTVDRDPRPAAAWRVDGERTCAIVYGDVYGKLRENMRALHPALDAWMIDEGYGKILARPGIPLTVRELCIVAACLASGQDRQLHSHLQGALNAGVAPAAVRGVLDALAGVASPAELDRGRLLFERVVGKP